MRTNFVKYHIIIKTKIFETMYVPIFLTLNYFIKFLYKFSSIYSHFLCWSLSVSAWTPSDPHAQQSCSGTPQDPVWALTPSGPALGLSLDPVEHTCPAVLLWASAWTLFGHIRPASGPALGLSLDPVWHTCPAVLLWASAWTLFGHIRPASGPALGLSLDPIWHTYPAVLLWDSPWTCLAHTPSSPALGLSLDPIWHTRPAVLLWGSAWTPSGTHIQRSCSGAQLDPVWHTSPTVLLLKTHSCFQAQPLMIACSHPPVTEIWRVPGSLNQQGEGTWPPRKSICPSLVPSVLGSVCQL